MGFSDSGCSSWSSAEALILAVLGFLPGLLVAAALYRADRSRDHAADRDDAGRAAIFVLVLTVVMCCGSALFALRKLRSADPAEIF